MKESLNRAECAMLKAVAIMMIMSHNFCHLLKNMNVTAENEYSFSMERIIKLCYHLSHPDLNLLHHLLSFFGHYGVPVFLFLSGYGLVMKYEQTTDAMPSPGKFIGQHYVKLLKLMLLGVVGYYVCLYFLQDNFRLGKKIILFISQLSMGVNILPRPWYHIKPGPYWFFGLMMELYVIYRLLLYAPKDAAWRRWVWPVAFILVCWLSQEYGLHHDLLIWMRYNFFVAALPFSFGMLAARYQPSVKLARWKWAVVCIIAAVMVGLMNFRLQLWLWSPVPVIVSAIALVKALPTCCHRPLVWIGGVSAMLFVVHPLVRVWIVEYAYDGGLLAYGLLLLYLAVSMVLAVGYRWLLNRVKI
ncbi:MAG: acyltransferase [Muribaculaceae bacterium]|nr:acyltransferase [Muribaculaceae bacterium]